MKRGRKPKSKFYHIRWNTVGLNEERATDAPPMAEQLLLLWDRKNINIEGWEGFIFSRGVLRCKNRRWTAKRILELTGQKQQLCPILKNLFY